MSLKLVPFESLGAVSYSPSIVTVAVSVAVCAHTICRGHLHGLEIYDKRHSRSLETELLDRSYTTYY